MRRRRHRLQETSQGWVQDSLPHRAWSFSVGVLPKRWGFRSAMGLWRPGDNPRSVADKAQRRQQVPARPSEAAGLLAWTLPPRSLALRRGCCPTLSPAADPWSESGSA